MEIETELERKRDEKLMCECFCDEKNWISGRMMTIVIKEELQCCC